MLSRTRQSGLSIVELMVGIAVGLLIVAGATLIVSSQLGNNRRLLLETQLQQDLRATADIITRELRRTGHWDRAHSGVWAEGGGAVMRNPFAAIVPASGATDDVSFSYWRRSGDTTPFGFKLETGIIHSRLGGAWQDLTDAQTMLVTGFTVTLSEPESYRLPCPRLCADGTQNCWPTLELRTATVDISARAKADATVTRTLSSSTRLRNDRIRFNDPLNPDLVCPA